MNLRLNVWIIIVQSFADHWPSFARQLGQFGNLECSIAVRPCQVLSNLEHAETYVI